MSVIKINSTLFRTTVLIFITLSLLACKQKMKEPPLTELIGLNETRWKEQVKLLTNENMLFNKWDVENFEDFHQYQTYFINGKDSLKTELTINDGSYYFGKLRSLVFSLKKDSIVEYGGGYKSYIRDHYPRNKKEVDKLLDWFVKLYGKPSDTISNLIVETSNSSNMNSKDSILDWEDIDQIIKEMERSYTPQSIKYLWEKEKFNIEFYKEFTSQDTVNYDNAYIKYLVKDFTDEVERISDSIRITLQPQDLIKIDFEYPQWDEITPFLKTFQIQTSIISRDGIEETRGITAFKFDLVILDKFNEEVYRLTDIKVNLIQTLFPYSIPVLINNQIISLKYNPYVQTFSKLENARKNNSKLKFRSEIKSVVFEDGEVLNQS